jgi:hypothetical protein
MEHNIGDMNKAGDDNIQDQGYLYDASALGVENYDLESFDSFRSLEPEGQPFGIPTIDPWWSFENVSDSAFSWSFYH